MDTLSACLDELSVARSSSASRRGIEAARAAEDIGKLCEQVSGDKEIGGVIFMQAERGLDSVLIGSPHVQHAVSQ